MIDVSNIEAVDFHAHVWKSRASRTISQLIEKSRALPQFRLMMASSEFKKMNEQELLKLPAFNEIRERFVDWPWFKSLVRYIARTYNCEPTLKDVDDIISSKLDTDFQEYVRSILDREKISKVLLDLRGEKKVSVDFPAGRYKWVFRDTHMIQPDWAKDRDATDLDQVLSLIEKELEECVKNRCSGLKSTMAYYRTLDIENVGEDAAKKAFKNLIKKKPVKYLPFPSAVSPAIAPVYEDPLDNKDLKLYQDFLMTRLLVRAGELDLCYLFHTGLDSPGGNPISMRTILDKEEVRTKTKTILLHTGYPFHAQTAIMAYKYPNVYAEVSWLMGWPEIYRDILKTFLEIIPSQKILYGSDATGVAERLGWCAWLFRKLLTEVLNEFIQKDGWTEEECLQVSKRILNENAKDILKIE